MQDALNKALDDPNARKRLDDLGALVRVEPGPAHDPRESNGRFLPGVGADDVTVLQRPVHDRQQFGPNQKRRTFISEINPC